ncbi:MAG TPA: hypothetical protein VHV29_08815 [Terriglobales bacterium]|jgi:hypothetical protein|nr:hypothetical protein [Terriglobales bacterium]
MPSWLSRRSKRQADISDHERVQWELKLKRMGATARESPHNLSITKAHSRSRIFEVKQIEYTLFGATMLLGGHCSSRGELRKTQLSRMWGQPPSAVRLIVSGRGSGPGKKVFHIELEVLK